MRKYKALIAVGLAAAYLTAPFAAFAAEGKQEAGKEKPKKKYILKTCLVSDEELGSMGDPFVFVHKEQEVKLCCKSCQKEFNKQTAKYLKKLEKLEKEEKAKKS